MACEQMRIGIVGAGFAAKLHAEMLRRVHSTSVRLHAVYAPTRKHREAFAAAYAITASESAEALIESCDVIHVCSPPSTHEAIAIATLGAGKHVVVEKPFTGFFGDGSNSFSGRTFDRTAGLTLAVESVKRMLEAEASSCGQIAYAENWVYAPAVQKEREVIERTGAQLLWLIGEESHSGSHSPYYGIWSYSGGGSLIGKGVHPLTAALYLKKVEGRVQSGKPIRPRRVSARTHQLTTMAMYRDAGHLRTDYDDVEDWSGLHVEFEDGTIADIYASEIVMGGVHNWLEINANNHRSRVNINPNNSFATYNPVGPQFDDIYVTEKIETKEGWAPTSPDEEWFTGYQHEMQAFYTNLVDGSPPESDSMLAADTTTVVYAAYVSAFEDGVAVDVPIV